jgi:hypothetical protein
VAPELTPYRLDRLENRVDHIEEKVDDIAVMRSELRGLGKMVETLTERADANQKALIATALSIAASAIIFAVTAFTVIK